MNFKMTEEDISLLEKHLKKHKKLDLVSAYLQVLETKFKLAPTLFSKTKKIYISPEIALKEAEKISEIWREAEVKITFGQPTVNLQTKKIYICPFSGKVFGDNTHPNPQDAIYEWVSSCPENKEYLNGIKVKRFFVSDDPDLIKTYITERKSSITKIAYSCIATGKVFNSKENAIEEFKRSQFRPMTLAEVQSQNKFELDHSILTFLQTHLTEDNLNTFVGILSEDTRFEPYIKNWIEPEVQNNPEESSP